jgi:flagellar hook-length control protein FliK
VSVSELDLGADWAADLLAASPAAEGAAPNGASTTGTQGTAYANFAARWDALASTSNDPSPATAATTPENTSRAETIQNLAEKMGHAIGQRILSEMEKGQWHLKLQLRPATLGHIEVEMRLRSGEFDAVFTAPHHLTRDLLQDGMSRLKETLSQMGMDVASIHVQDGQSGQRGGESTPGGSLAGQAKEASESKETQTDPSLAQQVKKPSDGLDILV